MELKIQDLVTQSNVEMKSHVQQKVESAVETMKMEFKTLLVQQDERLMQHLLPKEKDLCASI